MDYCLRIMNGNYDLVYHHAEKLRFIEILAYPKSQLMGFLKRKILLMGNSDEDGSSITINTSAICGIKNHIELKYRKFMIKYKL